ncbi:pantoate--beta-alanine ligase [Halalkalibacter urbisdiaboli]|uniref:pantoate--beta-alanine ligase n=1 Tax=Halalkalibacter urbisdiaboli TaxID=1960589 RepID=UPI000B44CB68|nr:pantoate--beta-alanine ligase [Halalkalibacter urbisdiaboli]
MRIVKTIQELRTAIAEAKSNHKKIGFVPTMGFLHEGHKRLLHQANEDNDIVVLSIFVNPLQFGPNEDFDRYPRDFERDEQIARNAGVNILFYPSISEMYPEEPMMIIQVKKGVDVLCGASRPGHFDGVATVVMKLFQLVQPERAYFGMKDAQQVAIIMNMVDTFNIPIEIIPCDTVREQDGLAKSSRNVYLSPEERNDAPKLYEALQKASDCIKKQTCTRSDVIALIKDDLQKLAYGEIDYVDVLSYPRLEPIEELSGKIIVALAYKYEKARLIDNILVNAATGKEC